MLRPRVQHLQLRRALATLGRSDNWGAERLGLHMRNPIDGLEERLVYKQGSGDPRKNSFNQSYFRSEDCRKQLKIAFQGAIQVIEEDGHHAAMAGRYIRKGEIIERGILRAIDDAALDAFQANPFVLRAGHDFLLGLPWSMYPDRPGPGFLPSGSVMTYKRDHEDFNVELTVKESHVAGFEFDVVAVEDIPLGAKLKRRVSPTCQTLFPGVPRYAELGVMSDADVAEFLDYQGKVDERNAANLPAGTSPPELHSELIYEHARLTTTSAVPVVNCGRTVCLPHPRWDGYGVFASEDIRKGEIVESGLMHELKGLDGNKCPYVFTWNKDGKRHEDHTQNRWCTGGGCAMFYNSDFPANVRMYRFHNHFRYLIVATQDIAEGEELMHLYVSSSWRKCFTSDDALPKALPVE